MRLIKHIEPGKRKLLPVILMALVFLLSPVYSASGALLARDQKIKASAGAGGSIDPSGDVKVKRYSSITFTIEADSDYEIDDVVVDGESVGPVSSYTFYFVRKDHTIRATFKPRLFTITAKAGEGGEISPSGEVRVDRGDDQAFTIEADPGYEILDVKVDGDSKGAVSSYTFKDVNSNHRIEATFKLKTYTITATAGDGGEITPSGEIDVEHGEDQIFTIEAATGYVILDVEVDDVGQGALSTYTFTNVSSDHSIRAIFVRQVSVLGVSIPNFSMKIGDVVEASIEVADDGGSAYSFVSGAIGEYPLEDFRRVSATSYLADFTITEGGNSYLASEDIPVSGLVISDGEMNSTSYDLPIVQDSDPIDAQAPVILKLEVPSLAIGVGGMVSLTITADESDYVIATGTIVNGIPYSSTRLSLTVLGNGQYELSFIVEAGDTEVAPGALEASILMMDEAGNLSNTYEIIETNSLEIYTDLPEATLVGPSEICEGEEVELSVHLRGRSPWSFDLDDGTNTTTFADITNPDFKILVAPFLTTTYRVSSVRDVNGVENINNGEFPVTVNEVSDVEIINLETGYDVEADRVLLEANIPGGTFSGPGVISATGYFYPDVADTINSPHTIYYNYTNDNGCISADSALVYVLGNEGGILIPARSFCKGELPFEITVFNVTAASGSFSLLNSNGEEVSGLTDYGDNRASIAPDSLDAGIYTIEYRYVDLFIHQLSTEFSIEAATPPQILNLYDTTYCQNINPFVLQANMPGVIFEGEGISGSADEGFTFNPSEVYPGSIWITATAETANACKASTREQITIKFAPSVMFNLNSECLPEGGELVSFENQTPDMSLVESWMWNFGDPGSGAQNQSDLANPTHLYQYPGVKNIMLKAYSLDGCLASHTMEALIDSKPVADFTWVSDCFTPGSAVSFINQSTIGSAIVDTVIWTFKSADGSVLDEIGSSSVSDTIEYGFTSPDRFSVSLYSRNKGGCYSELSKDIILRPSIQLGSDGYLESFDENNGMWTVRSENELASWVWDVPDFTGHEALEGDKAWFTRLPVGIPDYNEHSWIHSPCFDFTEMNRPLIRMDLMRSFFPYLNGAVLQYREAISEGWQTIGDDTPGINWYNISNIINMPGGSSLGWGLEEFVPDTDWVTAIHDLDQVAGKPNVDLRIAISTSGQMEVGNQGMAVDNLQIDGRSKLTLLEHFTNSSDDTARMADDIVDALYKKHSKDVIDLQYHMAYPGNDIMNLNNPGPPSTRSGNYGIPRIPYVVLDGGFSAEQRYDYPGMGGSSLKDQLRLLSLEPPVFDIDLSVNWMITSLEATATVTCMADHYDENIQLFVVVFEHTVSSYTGENGDTQFRNVVLDMLPTPAGKLLGDSWRKGDQDSRVNTWAYAPYVEDGNELAVVAFVQDRNTGQILQAAVDYRDKTVGFTDRISTLRKLDVYPNPANQEIYANLGDRTTASGRIDILDINGRLVSSELVPAGSRILQLDLGNLSPGMYMLRWTESDMLRGVSKFVKMK